MTAPRQPMVSPTSGAVVEFPQWVTGIVREQHAGLLRYAFSLCRDEETARDAVQETYLRLCRETREKIEPRLPAWLFTVCRTRVLDILRKTGRMNPLEDESAARIRDGASSPLAQAEVSDAAKHVMALLETLPPAQQEIIRLKFQGGMSYKEMAEVTNKSVNHVGVLLHTALKQLRQQVASETDLLDEAEGGPA